MKLLVLFFLFLIPKKKKIQFQRQLQVFFVIRNKHKIKMGEKKKEVIRLEREAVIPILKHKLTTALSLHFAEKLEREEFLKFCQRVEYTIRAWYHLHFEDLMQLYSLFEPIRGAHRLQQQNLSPHEIDSLEHQFLLHLFQVMEKSNFKVITNEEIQVALSAQYRLNLPIVVNETKLDTRLLTRFFSKCPRDDLPHFANKYIIFRRGFGIDHMKAYFFLAKVNTVLVRIWNFLLTITCLKRLIYGKKETGQSEQIDINIETEKDSLYIERIRIEKLKLSLSNLMKKITIQEPTFERIIVVYRRVSGKRESDRNIYVKHFKSIPMADMEIVLPEKQNPGLTPLDWVKFLVSAAIGLVTVVSSVSLKNTDIRVIAAILSTVVAYCVKTYFTFQRNLVDYQSLITRSVYDKQLDSGRGTLLHLCDEVIQQEVKEVIISFYMLIKQGRPTRKEELDMQCEAFIKEEFNESCNFDVDDAVKKLEKLGLVSRDAEDEYRCVNMKEANEIMGTTTEEMVLKARSGGEYEDEETAENEPQMNPEDELTAKEERFQSKYDEFETLWM